MIQYKWIASTKQYASPEISMQEKDVFDVIFNLLSVSPRRRCLSFFFLLFAMSSPSFSCYLIVVVVVLCSLSLSL